MTPENKLTNAQLPWSIRAAETLLERHPSLTHRWHYEPGVALLAIQRVWEQTKDPRYFEYIQRNMDAFIDESGEIRTYNLEDFNLILYPFISGMNAYESRLEDRHWIEFGWALKQFHSTVFSNEVVRSIPQESFSPKWRERLRSNLERPSRQGFQDPLAVELAAFLDSQRAKTLALVDRAESLAQTLSSRPDPMILCHGDIHGWNLLVDQDGKLYLVDWDTLVLAPKERDLMFVGGGLGGVGRTPQEEMDLFYQGYGEVKINAAALAYYRCERIIEDLAIYCSVIFDSSDGGEDRRQSLGNLKSNYQSGGTLEIAMETPGLG